MNKCFPFLLLLGLLTGCIRFFPATSINIPDEPKFDVEPFSEVILSYSTELKYDKELHLLDSKIFYDEYVRRIQLRYESQQIIELCDARELIVDLVEGLTKRFNENANARGYMVNNHFNADDYDIYIRFGTFYTKYIDELCIGWVSLRHGTVTFYAGDTTDYDLPKMHCRTEPYDKSRLYVRVMRNSEEHYKLTHPEPTNEGQYFGESDVGPVEEFVY